jgi:hypothetical protein
MILGNVHSRGRRLQGLRGRGLGVTSTMVNGNLEYGSDLVRSASPVYRAPVRGTIAYPVQVNQTPNVFYSTAPNYPSEPLQHPIAPAWGNNGPQGWGAGGSGWGPTYTTPTYGGGVNNPANANNLAQLTLQYQANPASLTAQQWQQLQAAGAIPSTVPYSNAGLVNPLATTSGSTVSSGIDPATGVPYATELAEAQAGVSSTSSIGTDFSTLYAGIPLYMWLGGAVLIYFVMSGKRR